jgi:hypothetical protein
MPQAADRGRSKIIHQERQAVRHRELKPLAATAHATRAPHAQGMLGAKHNFGHLWRQYQTDQAHPHSLAEGLAHSERCGGWPRID